MRYVQKAIKRCLPRSAWSLGLLVKQRRKKKFHKLIIQQNMCANGKPFKNSQKVRNIKYFRFHLCTDKVLNFHVIPAQSSRKLFGWVEGTRF